MPRYEYRCPECESTIQDMTYDVELNEWGNVYIDAPETRTTTLHEATSGNYSMDGSDWTESPTLRCGECEAELPNGLLPIEIDEEDDEEENNEKQ